MLELTKVSIIMNIISDSIGGLTGDCTPVTPPCGPTDDCQPMNAPCRPVVMPCEPDLICTPTILP